MPAAHLGRRCPQPPDGSGRSWGQSHRPGGAGCKAQGKPAGWKPGPGHSHPRGGSCSSPALLSSVADTGPPEDLVFATWTWVPASALNRTSPPGMGWMWTLRCCPLSPTPLTCKVVCPRRPAASWRRPSGPRWLEDRSRRVRPGTVSRVASSSATHPSPSRFPARRSSRSAECSFRARSSGVSWAWRSAREQALNAGAEPWCSTACSTCWCSPGEEHGITRTGFACPTLGVSGGPSGSTPPPTPA